MKTSSNKIFCLVGPSGSGKSAITESIPLPQVISYRTRPVRAGEIDGVHGHFISIDDVYHMSQKELWIAETEYAGNFYGITQGDLLELEDKPMLYVVDWPGVVTLKEAFEDMEGYSPDEVVSIFIYTPRTDLEARMIKQGRKRDEIKVRLDRADRDYAVSGRCDHIIENTNGNFDKAIADVMKIIVEESFK